MADLMQGEMLPSTITTSQKATTAPEFYTNYLQDIANLGQNAITQGGVAGLSPLTEQALSMAPTTAFAGSGTMGAGAQLAGTSGTTAAPDILDQYMNPYIKSVVDEMGRQQQQNIQRNVLPALSAAGAATGNFGSSRQAGMTGQTLTDMQANLLGQQYGALNTGFNTAMTSAQSDLNRQLQAGQALGNIGVQQSNIGTTGLKTLTDLGGLEQKQGQTILDKPMLDASNFAKLLQSYSIPVGSTEQSIAPGQQGQFQNSPLSSIAGLAALISSLYPTTNQSAADAANNAAAAANVANSAKTYGLTLQADGSYKDSSDNIFNWNGAKFVQKVAQGGLVQNFNDGGSVSNVVSNDAAGGNTYTFAY
jgi:hypothetical protein